MKPQCLWMLTFHHLYKHLHFTCTSLLSCRSSIYLFHQAKWLQVTSDTQERHMPAVSPCAVSWKKRSVFAVLLCTCRIISPHFGRLGTTSQAKDKKLELMTMETNRGSMAMWLREIGRWEGCDMRVGNIWVVSCKSLKVLKTLVNESSFLFISQTELGRKTLWLTIKHGKNREKSSKTDETNT